jgi:hypothetical protein
MQAWPQMAAAQQLTAFITHANAAVETERSTCHQLVSVSHVEPERCMFCVTFIEDKVIKVRVFSVYVTLIS